MKNETLSILARWTLPYFVIIELVYLSHEILLVKSSSQDPNVLVLGLLLAAGTMPTSTVLYVVMSHLAFWMGLHGGDTREFLPRFVAVQPFILVNAAVVALFAISCLKGKRRAGPN